MRDRLELRAQHPVSQCLIGRLIVPRIYFGAEWPGLDDGRVDVLALDRDGTGDAHLVEIRRSAADALALVPRLMRARSPYRWIAFLRGTEDDDVARQLAAREVLYPEGSAGRIGVIEVVEVTGDDLGANVIVGAERFPTPVYDLAMEFSESHQADIQFGA